MYLWGVSLGAVISTQYLIHDDENSPYSALVCYGAPFGMDETMDAFKEKGFGIYDFFLGFFINMKARGLMDEMVKFASKEKMEVYRKGLYEESFRLTAFDNNITAPMFGFKSNKDYYRAGRITGKLNKIKKCPIMFIEAEDDFM